MFHSSKVYTNLPLNLKSEHAHFFKKFRAQDIDLLKVKKLKNVFVNQQGLVLKNGLLVEGCAFNLKGNVDNTFYYPFWRKTIEQYLVCKFGKSLKSIVLKDDRNYLLIHSAWFNYSFWVNSYLLRLITVLKNNDTPNLHLIYLEEWDLIPYVKESLIYFDVKIERIPKDHHFFVKNLIMPETRKWTNSFDKNTIREVYNWFSFLKYNHKPTRKVYLTRKKRNVRCVDNEEQLIHTIKQYDFEVVEFEMLSFIEQVKLMMETSHFISIHGAGFSNMLFMQPKTTVMELINIEYAKVEYTFPFWKLADTLNLNYYYQFGSVPKNISFKLIKNNNYELNKDYLVNQNIHINIELFDENLKLMLSNSNL